jgi:hypothetical protein
MATKTFFMDKKIGHNWKKKIWAYQNLVNKSAISRKKNDYTKVVFLKDFFEKLSYLKF